MELKDKFARWADKQGWFRLTENNYVLPDGSRLEICLEKRRCFMQRGSELVKCILLDDDNV